MFNKAILALSAVSMVALPTAAEARHHSYNNGYDQGYYGGGYDQGYYGNGYNQGYYGNGYDQGYYNQGYNGDRYYSRRHRCGKGTTGLIVGGAAGALIGREVTRNNNRYSYRRNSGTTGAIIGGALGALVGREVARSC